MRGRIVIYKASLIGLEGLKKNWKTLRIEKKISPDLFEVSVSRKEYIRRRPPIKIFRGKYLIKPVT